MADWGIRATKRNLDHNDIERQRPRLLVKCPATELIIRRACADLYVSVVFCLFDNFDELDVVGVDGRFR
jgi:hypothetical protein